MKRLFPLLLILVGLSCSEELVPKPYTYTQIFTGEVEKTWEIKFFEETLNGEVTGTFSVECAEDDLYTFNNDFERSLEIQTKSKKCNNPAEPSIINDTWAYSPGSSTLSMIIPIFSPDISLPFIVRNAEKNKMELEIFFDNNTASYRIHFSAIEEK